MIPFERKLKAFGLGIGICLGAFLVLFVLFHKFEFTKDIVDRLDGYCYDRLFPPERNVSKELVIVDLDTTSRILDRSCCAELIAGLQKAQAKVVGFDVLFLEKKNSLEDRQFISSIKIVDNVVHAFNLTHRESPSHLIESSVIPYALKRNSKPKLDACIKAVGVELPFQELLEASKYLGHINFERDNDGHIRRLPSVLCFGNYIYLSLSLQMVRLFFDIKDNNLKLYFENNISGETSGDNYIFLISDNGSVIRKIPVDNVGQMLINYSDNESFTSYKIKDALELLKKIERDINPFKNKLVLVVNSKFSGDESYFPQLGEESLPNWIIHASVINQIIENEYITESSLNTITFSFIAVLLLLTWLVFIEIRFPWLRKNTWLVVLSVSLILIITAFIMLYAGNWPGVILPGIVLYTSYFSSKSYLKKWKPPSLIKYLDFELQVQEKTKSRYLVDVIKSPAGEEAEGEFTLNLKKSMGLVNKLQTFSVTREEVRNFGKTLFNALFQHQTQRRYDESLGIVGKSEQDRLRIKLRIEPAELSVLPWEYLYDPVRRTHLAMSDELSIVRYPLIPRDIEPLEVKPPVKILVLISAPSDCAPLQVKKEKMKIIKALKKLKWKHQIKLDILNKATVEKVGNRIGKYHVIHYIGHGGFIRKQQEEKGCLVFENESGLSDLVDAEQLGLLLDQTPVRLIILNACETAKTSTFDAFMGVAPALVNAGVPAVIAMQFPIPDQSAIIFSEEFYKSLVLNYQVDAALTNARKAMAIKIGIDRIDWGIPVLFMRAPDGIIFRPKAR